MKFTKLFLALSLCLLVFGIQAQENKEEPTSSPEKAAMYVGGANAMKQYLVENIHYPDSAKQEDISGKIYVRFVVEKDGSISSIEVLKGVNDSLNEEAKRVIASMPKWTPAESEGIKVRSYVILPIMFDLD